MECKEIQKLLKEFVNEELLLKQEEMMVDHLKTCNDCREELEIYYIIGYGLGDDENIKYPSPKYKTLSESYDFKGLVELILRDVKDKIRKEKEYIKFMKATFFTTNILIICTAAMMLFLNFT